MLKKILTVAAALAMSLVSAPAAVAWDEVCMELPFWRVSYRGQFHVVHGFTDGRMPGHYHSERGTVAGLPWELGVDNYRGVADGRISSEWFTAGFSRCVSIRHLPEGTAFFVYVESHLIASFDLCSTHSSNRERYYTQRRRPYSRIWYQGTGQAGSARCDYWKESH